MTYIKRQISSQLQQAFQLFPAIFLTGPRQSGKTTLLQHLFPQFTYHNLETPSTLSRAKNDPLNFLQPDQLILDEAQEAPWLFSYLLEIIDNQPKKQIIIAGSQNLLLHTKINQSLAGRVGIFELFPFTFTEVKSELSPAKLDQTILTGFYPRAFLHPSSQTFLWHQSYLKTYLERDIRSLKHIKDLLVFQQFIQLLAGQAGNLLNLSNISNTLGVSVTTLKEWLSVLEASYLTFRLPPYFANIKKRLVKTPKIYFYDTGLLCTLLDIRTPTQLTHHPLYGQIFENFIIAEIAKNLKHQNQGQNLYFLRDKTGNEIDLIIENSGELQACEIKTSATFNPNFISKISYFQKLLPITHSTIIYQGLEEFTFQQVRFQNWLNLSQSLPTTTIHI